MNKRKFLEPKYENGKVMCLCEPPDEAAFRTTQKQGPNFGRPFYTCPNPKESACKMFMWADQRTSYGDKPPPEKNVNGNYGTTDPRKRAKTDPSPPMIDYSKQNAQGPNGTLLREILDVVKSDTEKIEVLTELVKELITCLAKQRSPVEDEDFVPLIQQMEEADRV
jgi:hypothetical protein